MNVDVAIIGGGPAGLATAIGAAVQGLKVHVFEKQNGPVDKACGEGLMPSGLSALDRLGALKHVDRNESAPFESIVYVQESGERAIGKLPPPGGLGLRRLELSRALRKRADEVGVVVHEHTGVRTHSRTRAGVEVVTDAETFTAGVLIGADGLNSQSRTREGLAGPTDELRRFGLRRHFAIAPWTKSVEVHFSPGVEAYVTPAGAQRVGVAFLWVAGSALVGDVDFGSLLSHFPALEEKLRGVTFDSTPRGAGPLLQHVNRRVAERFALVGDAAGYVDAITGEGITQALEGAEALAKVLPEVIARNGAIEAFAPYEFAAEAAFARYARLANALVWISQRPMLRRRVISLLAKSPRLFEETLKAALK
jgi:2-polyprenyl-6-methoxyphenol hydroxylase-like FAD-dependent oxidoreductase